MNHNRVVVDTNVFISALLNPQGKPREVINIAISQFVILQSEVTYQELESRISKKKFDKYLEESNRLKFLKHNFCALERLPAVAGFIEFYHKT